MRSWPYHAAFALILVGSLAFREQAGDVLDESAAFEAAVVGVAGTQGLGFLGQATMADSAIATMIFAGLGCSQQVSITVLDGAFDQDIGSGPAREQGEGVRYVYIDRAWDRPNRLGFFIERMKYAALAVVGLTEYQPSWHLLRIASPPGCKVADKLDWKRAWDRNYLKTFKDAGL